MHKGGSNKMYLVGGLPSAKILEVFYYDEYTFNSNSAFIFSPFGFSTIRLNLTRGLPTGSKTRILLDDGSLGSFLTTVMYYNLDYQPLQTYTQNHKGGWDKVNYYYNEYKQVEKTMQYHKYEASSASEIFSTRFSYHPKTGEVHNVWCKINSDPEIMVSRSWYENGRLIKKGLHRDNSANYMQHLDYRYNAQGNLTHINNASLTIDAYNDEDYDVFGQQMVYHDLDPAFFPYDPANSSHSLELRHDGLISGMMWNAKTGEEDGATLSKNLYVYRYDDFGQMVGAYYSADHPGLPGEFDQSTGAYDELVEYDLRANIRKLKRSIHDMPGSGSTPLMDDLTYSYMNGGYKLAKVSDAGLTAYSGQYKHFVDGINTTNEYIYDSNARLIEDKNRGVTFSYNHLGLPRRIIKNYAHIRYTYDAAGNKLQKHNFDVCPIGTLCAGTDEKIDYIGNFIYRDGELEMIYHPEGVLRPTPWSADNETEFVYDYFIKDYLGNVRVVMTEENATYTDKFLATMEEVHAIIEEENFDNVNETREELPTGYPLDGSVYFNERIAYLSQDNGTEIGPSLVMPVMRGDKVSLRTDYFYTEDASGATYNNFDLLLNDVLIALAASASGVVRLGESQLLDIASGNWSQTAMLEDLLADNFDTTDVYKPYAYLVWVLYDNDMKIIPGGSGAKRVLNPNDLEQLIEEDIAIADNGYLHAYVMNGTANGAVSFDNFLVSYLRGKTRQINHCYPFGLSIAGLGGDYDEYLNKYTSKELQTGEFASFGNQTSGLEMFDFHARFYDPQLGRWFTQDPAEQFSNPYLGIGNNPVMYVDPDGKEVVTLATVVIVAKASAAAAGIAAAAGAVTIGSIIAAQTIANLASVSAGNLLPPDGYLYDRAKDRSFRINDDGADEGINYYYEGTLHSDGKYSLTGRFVSRPLDNNAIIKLADNSLYSSFSSVSTEPGFIATKIQSIAAKQLQYNFVTPSLKISNLSLAAAPASKTSLGLSVGGLGTSSGAALSTYYAGILGGNLVRYEFPNLLTGGENFWYGGPNGTYLGNPLNQVPHSLNVSGGLKFASAGLKVGGGVMGAYGLYSTATNFVNNRIPPELAVFDAAFGIIGFLGVEGAIYSFSYELGKLYGPSKWYGRNDTKWFK